jgi:exopolyphosphatase/guanosine-5'-triphosphate,3'-diphosphate pyrophosphatase
MNKSYPVAVIEIGTNSIKFIIAKKSEHLGLQVLYEKTIEQRIGAGISASNLALSQTTIKKLIATLLQLIQYANNHSVASIRIVATSAVREASNRDELSQCIQEACQIKLEILSGETEALYIGKAIQLDSRWQSTEALNIIDLGGGSLEYIEIKNHTIIQASSLPLGAVRLSEQFTAKNNSRFESDTLSKIQAHVDAQISAHSIKIDPQVPLLGSGGAFHILKNTFKFKEPLEKDALLNVATTLGFETIESRISHYGVPEKRADIFPIAVATLYALMNSSEIKVLHPSQFNLKFGILKEMLKCSAIA